MVLSRVCGDYIRRVLDWQLDLLDHTQLHTITVYTLYNSLCSLQHLPSLLAVSSLVACLPMPLGPFTFRTNLQLCNSSLRNIACVKVKVTLRPTTSRSISLGFEPRLGQVPLACSLLCWTILRPWRWRRYVAPKRRVQLYGLHGVISQKMILFIPSVDQEICLVLLMLEIHNRVHRNLPLHSVLSQMKSAHTLKPYFWYS
jgi:hypothetical protein